MVKLLRTKSFWVGVSAICAAVGMGLGGQMSWAEVIQTIIGGIAAITMRHAIVKGK